MYPVMAHMGIELRSGAPGHFTWPWAAPSARSLSLTLPRALCLSLLAAVCPISQLIVPSTKTATHVLIIELLLERYLNKTKQRLQEVGSAFPHLSISRRYNTSTSWQLCHAETPAS